MLSNKLQKKLQARGRRIEREAKRHYTNPIRCSNYTSRKLAELYQIFELQDIDNNLLAVAVG